MKDTPLSACIIAMNEADRLGACIESLDFCDEILVVDSHSSDDTRALAESLGARVIERDWPGHVAQKEFTIRAASHDWVFCIDADERVSPELRKELLALKAQGFSGDPAEGRQPAGWRMPRLTRWMGRWIRHGSWYPDYQLRLFDRRRGHWGAHDPHDRVQLEGRPGTLKGQLLHETYRDIGDHLRTIDSYTEIAAKGMLERGKRARVSDIWLRPIVSFVRFYILKHGFLMGWRGLALAYLAAHYVRLKYLRLLILQRKVG